MGIGALILFISLLLVAAIAAGVLIQSTSSMQEKSLKTGKQTRDDVASGINIVDITATDGTDGDVELFKSIFKLNPGSSSISLSNLLVTIGTENVTTSLQYRGPSGTDEHGNDGYNTWTKQELGELGSYFESVALVDDNPAVNLNIDLDLDGVVDTVVVCRAGITQYCPAFGDEYVQFNLSTAGLIQVPIYTITGATHDVSVPGPDFGNVLTPIDTYGYMSTSGTSPGGWRIPAGQLHVYQTPEILNEDLDDDGADDSLVINDTHVILHYSSKGNISEQLNLTQGVAYPLGADLSSGGQALDIQLTLQDNASATVFATLNISGTSSRASFIDSSVKFQVTPYRLFQGYFTVSYIQTGSNHRLGDAHTGDVMRLFFETPRGIGEDEQIHFHLIPETGTRSTAIFYMPNIISDENVNLYP